MWTGRVLSMVVLCAVLPACAAEGSREAGEGRTSTPPSRSVTTEPTAGPTSTPTTQREQVRAVLRDREPDAEDVIALAKRPMAWTAGDDRLLVEYWVTYPGLWPTDPAVVAAQVLDRRGRVLGEYVPPSGRGDLPEHWPAGRAFVGMAWDGSNPFLVSDDTVTPLTRERGTREAGPGDVRFGPGWLLDEAAGTVTRERLPGCRQDSIRTVRGRVWCLDARKKRIAWSDDGGSTWSRHALSGSYFEYCDGGTLGADLAVQGDVVSIGLQRADFSLDRGRTWHDVVLPVRLVGVRPTPYETNCTRVEPLADGRLVLEYFGIAVADDPTNTRFSMLRTPPDTRYAGMHEGVMLSVSREPYGAWQVSHDGGRTWLPLELDALAGRLLPTDP